MADPILHTERLILREFTEDDADFVLALLNDPGWQQHISDPGVRTPAQARDWIGSRLLASYLRHGYGLWAMVKRDDGALLGMCGFVRRDSLPEVDIGYALLPSVRGQGYVREAVHACLRHGQAVLGFRRVLAITGPDNLASQRVLENAGMRLEDRRVLEGATRESLVYAWQAAD
jgi:RimJ/RimL family protein N-acetyltransferase